MTDVATTADIVNFRKRPMTNAERQKAWRERQRAAKLAAGPVELPQRVDQGKGTAPHLGGPAKPAVLGNGLTGYTAPTPVTPKVAKPRPAAVTIDVTPVTPVTRRPFEASKLVLRLVSVALAGVGMSMNAVYAHSLGSNDLSGWLFLGLGVAADASALVLPSVAASNWKASQRLAAGAAWAVFVLVFAFALIGAVGFASTSISDVTTARASRVTPAVTAAQAALADAQAARDRECKGGVGKFCREREATVATMRQNLDTAMAAVAQTGDPQAAALVGVVTWVSRGSLVPSEADVSMLRLILMSLLPQVGGILLMASKR